MAEFVTVAHLEDVPPGSVKTFFVGNQHLALANVEGQIYAIQDVCSHDGGPLGEGEVEGYEVECPRHGARFDLRTGAVRSFPAVVGIKTYQTKVDGSDIKVAIND